MTDCERYRELVSISIFLGISEREWSENVGFSKVVIQKTKSKEKL